MTTDEATQTKTELEVQEIENTIRELVSEARGTDHPATKAAVLANTMELPMEGGTTAIAVVNYLVEKGYGIPQEFEVYIDHEKEYTDSLPKAHFRAMARRGVEDVVYKTLRGKLSLDGD